MQPAPHVSILSKKTNKINGVNTVFFLYNMSNCFPNPADPEPKIKK
jgi:hypothetical protein